MLVVIGNLLINLVLQQRLRNCTSKKELFHLEKTFLMSKYCNGIPSHAKTSRIQQKLSILDKVKSGNSSVENLAGFQPIRRGEGVDVGTNRGPRPTASPSRCTNVYRRQQPPAEKDYLTPVEPGGRRSTQHNYAKW